MGTEPNIEEHIWKLQTNRPHVSRPRLQKSIVLGKDWTIDHKAMLRAQKKMNPKVISQSLFCSGASV